ncbi:hypothetical protein DPMN_164113 [Dreissena polymorpha]|uniref:Ig-like domain-containing protein n=1 Tax=Dreissena polymorpha TaxID=45954 RepID=A0A9D4EUK6_DREPO|nr:hypothetical protein DPMN_164113 [Dreissena polymorpha]
MLSDDITYSAICNPACTYTWTKSGGATVDTTNGVLSLGTLQRGEADNSTCIARNPGSSVTTTSKHIGILVRCKLSGYLF